MKKLENCLQEQNDLINLIQGFSEAALRGSQGFIS